MRTLFTTLAITLLFSCQNSAQVSKAQLAIINAKPIEVPDGTEGGRGVVSGTTPATRKAMALNTVPLPEL